MIYSVVLQVVGGIASLWLAKTFIPGVRFIGSLQTFLVAGAVLGLINAFVKPILNLLTFPLRILTLGLSAFFIQLGLIWLLDSLFPELVIQGFAALLWTTLAVSIVGVIIALMKK